MDTQRIETFICAAENRTFSATAKLLNVSQPTVSHQVQALETELGVILFERKNTGLKLTEAGRLLLPWARRLMQDTNDLKETMDSLRDEVAGEIRIACSTTAGKYLLPQIGIRFRRRYPGVRIRILACRPEQATLELTEGEAELGVVSSELMRGSIEVQPFYQDHVILIAPADHPWRERAYIEPHEILGQPFLMREPDSGTHRVLREELAKFDIMDIDLSCEMELGNAEAIVNTVCSGLGVSFVSSLAAKCAMEHGRIIEVPVKNFELRRTIFMARKRIGAPHRPRDAFWSFIHISDNQDLLNLPSQTN